MAGHSCLVGGIIFMEKIISFIFNFVCVALDRTQSHAYANHVLYYFL